MALINVDVLNQSKLISVEPIEVVKLLVDFPVGGGFVRLHDSQTLNEDNKYIRLDTVTQEMRNIDFPDATVFHNGLFVELGGGSDHVVLFYKHVDE